VTGEAGGWAACAITGVGAVEPPATSTGSWAPSQIEDERIKSTAGRIGVLISVIRL
jgi:hypothetical protein